MLLAIDIGNTETTIALFQGENVFRHWRVTTDNSRTDDEIGLLLTSLLRDTLSAMALLDGISIGSVVPPLTQPFTSACEKWLGRRAIVVDASSKLPIQLDVLEPLSVGADRIINTLAASHYYKRDAIVVDLGTATTFDCITKKGVFIGGVIAPGIRVSAETLFRRTSKLPAADLVAPSQVIGKRTEDCIRAGVLFGAADSIDGIVRRIKNEWPEKEIPLVIATGGLAELIAPICSCIDKVEPLLTLRGLALAHSILSSSRTGQDKA